MLLLISAGKQKQREKGRDGHQDMEEPVAKTRREARSFESDPYT